MSQLRSSNSSNRTVCYTHGPFITPSLDLASLPRYLQAFVILKASGVPEVSITLVAGDPIILLDAGRNGRTGKAPVLRPNAKTHVARGEQALLSHGRRQVRDDVVMLTVTEQVDPLECSYLTVKHDAVPPQP